MKLGVCLGLLTCVALVAEADTPQRKGQGGRVASLIAGYCSGTAPPEESTSVEEIMELLMGRESMSSRPRELLDQSREHRVEKFKERLVPEGEVPLEGRQVAYHVKDEVPYVAGKHIAIRWKIEHRLRRNERHEAMSRVIRRLNRKAPDHDLSGGGRPACLTLLVKRPVVNFWHLTRAMTHSQIDHERCLGCPESDRLLLNCIQNRRLPGPRIIGLRITLAASSRSPIHPPLHLRHTARMVVEAGLSGRR